MSQPPSYSVGGYLKALQVRSNLTILVEGSDDRKIIGRLLCEPRPGNPNCFPPFVIDTAQIIRSEPGAPIGNKDKVEAIAQQAGALNLDFAALVDREFRDFFLTIPVKDMLESENTIGGTVFWTRGHSIENYILNTNGIEAFLIQLFPETLPTDWQSGIQREFSQLITWAAALSVAAHTEKLLEKAQGLLDIDCWTSSSPIQLEKTSVEKKLAQRAVPQDQSKRLLDLAQKLHEHLQGMPSALSQWLAHGHLGTEAVWTGVGKILKLKGLDEVQAQQIGTGQKESKLRVLADTWARTVAQSRGDLGQFIDRLR